MKDLGLWDDHDPSPNYDDGIDYGHIEYWQNLCYRMADKIIELTTQTHDSTTTGFNPVDCN
jgi:hypothetical protein